ncbi:MAG: hypothetical protein NTW16_13220, partial [Bacteroidetes bacterium]|nr:hypothetical protein [Bacteroidota bacterium]
MRKYLLLIIIIFSSGLLTYVGAQGVAINSNGAAPAPSAMLEVTASGKGMLIPRVALTGANDALTIQEPAVSLLVYNTSTAADMTPGFYYWSGARWQRLATVGSPGDAWGVNGNSGTNPDVNFIGTTDPKSLVFKVADTKAGMIDPFFKNTTFGMYAGLSLASTVISENSFFGNSAGFFTTLGRFNAFYGANAGGNNQTGSENSFFGVGAGGDNISSGLNCYFGYLTGKLNTGTRNSFFGSGAGNNGNNTATGNLNTFIGVNAGNNISSGSSNTLVGENTLFTLGTLVNATAIGARAMAGASNTLVLGSIAGVNSATADVNVGIGTNSPDTKLEVAGSSGVTSRLTSLNGSDVIFDFKRTGSDWRIRNSTGILYIGQSSDDLVTVIDVLRMGGGSLTPAADNFVT